MSFNLKQHLKQLEESHINLDVRQNCSELGRILADEFFEIGSSGFLFNKKQCLDDGVVMTETTLHQYEIYPLA